jgi:hypothetical protein
MSNAYGVEQFEYAKTAKIRETYMGTDDNEDEEEEED